MQSLENELFWKRSVYRSVKSDTFENDDGKKAREDFETSCLQGLKCLCFVFAKMKTEHSENSHQCGRGPAKGSFSIHSGDSSENITQKVNSPSFKLLPTNFISFSLSSFGEFF